MRDAAALDWAARRRRRWSATRIVAALALHAALLSALLLAVDRVQLPRRGADRATTLVSVALHAAPPPPSHALPLPRVTTSATVRASPRVPRDTPAAPRARPNDDASASITLPAPPATAGATAAPAVPASAAPADLAFLAGAGARQAIRDAARGGPTLAARANALTRDDPTAGERLARNIEAAHKGDCMKGEYVGGGMGLLSAPFLLAAEALGNCAHKL